MQEPLAVRLRPIKLDEIFGQKHLIGEDMLLRRCVQQQHLFSMIFYGEPGCGKTTLALALANELNLPYCFFSAVTGNKKDLTDIFEQAKIFPGMIVIIDEIHRLNKDKQDLLLPHIESGAITCIGATTSNPLFAINPALRSRCHLLEVKKLTNEDVCEAIQFALSSPKGYHNRITIDPQAIQLIANRANGDLRYAYNLLEICEVGCQQHHIDVDLVKKYSYLANSSIDNTSDGHYDAVSAFQKAIRGSDVNAAIYYLARLIMANDMDSIERRLLVIAYEDIGLANPGACSRTLNAIDAAKRVGFPEGMIPLAVAVIDLALSPKSKSANNAIHHAMDEVNQHPLAVPDYLKFSPTGLPPEEKYDYDSPNKWHRIQYLPDEIKDVEFYHPALTSNYEKALASNYQELKKFYRTNRLSTLNKK